MASEYESQSSADARARGGHMLTDRVDFDIYVTDADLEGKREWPPPRFQIRDQRLAMLDAFWRGDLSAFDISDVANVNYFHSYSTKLSNLLLMSRPMLGAPEEGAPEEPDAMVEDQTDGSLDLSDGAYDALIDMTRYGATLMAVTDNAEGAAELEIIDPLTWYPHIDGGAFTVMPFTSEVARTPEPDRVRVRRYPVDGGTVEETIREWQSGQLGDVVEGAEPATLQTTGIVTAQRTPRLGIWGTATYLEIASPIIEINRRGAHNSDLLDAYAGPIPVKEMAEVDAETRWPVENPSDEYAPTKEERLQAIIAGVRKEFGEGVIVLRDETQGITLLQPDVGGVMTSISQMEEMKLAIQSLTGLPSLTGEYQPPSGEALKRIYLPFYAESSALQTTLRLALEALFGEPVSWPHVFDVIELESRQRLMENARIFAPSDDDEEDVEVDAEAE